MSKWICAKEKQPELHCTHGDYKSSKEVLGTNSNYDFVAVVRYTTAIFDGECLVRWWCNDREIKITHWCDCIPKLKFSSNNHKN